MPSIAARSYGTDAGMLAQHVSAVLAERFGRRNVTLVDALADPQSRYAATSRSVVVILILGQDWPAIIASAPELQPVRGALEWRLRYSPVRQILPLLTEGAMMPPAGALPPGLQPLVYRQALSIRWGTTFAGDMGQAVSAISEHARQPHAARLAKGNYTWFKVLSVVPLATLFAFGIPLVVFDVTSLNQLSASQYAILLLMVSIMVIFVFGLWLGGAVGALVTGRFRWAIANALIVPLSFGMLYPAYHATQNLPNGSALPTILVAIGLIIWFGALFLWPIIFGLSLPPHRSRPPRV